MSIHHIATRNKVLKICHDVLDRKSFKVLIDTLKGDKTESERFDVISQACDIAYPGYPNTHDVFYKKYGMAYSYFWDVLNAIYW